MRLSDSNAFVKNKPLIVELIRSEAFCNLGWSGKALLDAMCRRTGMWNSLKNMTCICATVTIFTLMKHYVFNS